MISDLQYATFAYDAYDPSQQNKLLTSGWSEFPRRGRRQLKS